MGAQVNDTLSSPTFLGVMIFVNVINHIWFLLTWHADIPKNAYELLFRLCVSRVEIWFCNFLMMPLSALRLPYRLASHIIHILILPFFKER